MGWLMFKRRRFPIEIILVCVRWYCNYGISYRDLAEMMQERGVEVDPSTIKRWVHRYAPELEKRGSMLSKLPSDLAPRGRDICEGWRQVEVPVPGCRQAWPANRLHVDGPAEHPGSLSFPRKSINDHAPLPPSSITTAHGSYPQAISRLQQEGKLSGSTKHHTCK